MNDLSGDFTCATRVAAPLGIAGKRDLPVHAAAIDRPVRLSPPRAFSEAAALVEDALAQLRVAETALERQLGDLRAYINAPAAAH